MLCLYGGRSLYQKVLELTWHRLILSLLLPTESSWTAGKLSSTATLREQQRHLFLGVHSASALSELSCLVTVLGGEAVPF